MNKKLIIAGSLSGITALAGWFGSGWIAGADDKEKANMSIGKNYELQGFAHVRPRTDEEKKRALKAAGERLRQMGLSDDSAGVTGFSYEQGLGGRADNTIKNPLSESASRVSVAVIAGVLGLGLGLFGSNLARFIRRRFPRK